MSHAQEPLPTAFALIFIGRGLTQCNRHVWSGKEAKKIGLIDEIGGLQDAIYEASKLAGIENFNIAEYPIVEEDFESIFSEILPSIHFFNDLKKIKDITDPSSKSKSFENIKTLLPFKVKIK